ncbi:MAG: ArsR/SmtB family transcription factor, partial [bacterium]
MLDKYIFNAIICFVAQEHINIRKAKMHQEAELFKALSDPTRLRLVALLALHGEVCVCAMAEALDEPDFKISRHLRVLRSAGLVAARREGTW